MTGSAHRGSAAGFTLVEVLVALAIVAVALAAGLRASSALLNHGQVGGPSYTHSLFIYITF